MAGLLGMTALRSPFDNAWQRRHNGIPPDDDNYTYRWDRRANRWVSLDEPVVNEDALEEWEHRRRQRLAEANEY